MGSFASSGASLTRVDLSAEAIRLGRLVVALLPEPDAIGLLALMLLHHSRRDARVDAAGGPELGDRHRQRGAHLRVVGDAGALLAEDQQAAPRQGGLLEALRAGHVVDRDDRQLGGLGEGK